ncbi:MAG: hypothetical protein R2799_14700 [Crocinitomicaceae bacterium]
MKQLFLLLIVFTITNIFCQESFNLKVDSLIYEGSDSPRFPEKDMFVDLKNGKLILSGYSLFLEEGKSTEYALELELGEGSKNENYTVYRSNLYYNNPVPDHSMELYHYDDGRYKLVIISAAIITELYCSKR